MRGFEMDKAIRYTRNALRATGGAVLLALGATAQADDWQRTLESCQILQDSAAVIMEIRQEGSLSMAQALSASPDNSVWVALVRDAWSYPKFRTPEARSRAVREFTDSSYEQCLRMFD